MQQHHPHPMTLSERADELEEQMMNELNEKIATKSVLFTLADGKVEMEGGAALQAQESRQVLPDGRRSAAAEDAGQADADRFLQAAVRVDEPSAAERDPRAQGRA